MREGQLVDAVWRSNLFEHTLKFLEVPVGSWSTSTKRIDMIVLEQLEIEERIIAIEAKVSDWRTALKQAFRNLFAVNVSYVALPETCAARVDSSLFRDTGIGLLGVDGEVKCLIEGAPSKYTVPEKRNFVIKTCKERLGASDA